MNSLLSHLALTAVIQVFADENDHPTLEVFDLVPHSLSLMIRNTKQRSELLYERVPEHREISIDSLHDPVVDFIQMNVTEQVKNLTQLPRGRYILCLKGELKEEIECIEGRVKRVEGDC